MNPVDLVMCDAFLDQKRNKQTILWQHAVEVKNVKIYQALDVGKQTSRCCKII